LLNSRPFLLQNAKEMACWSCSSKPTNHLIVSLIYFSALQKCCTT